MLILAPNTLATSPMANSGAARLNSSLEIYPETKSSDISRANPLPPAPTDTFTAPQANKARFNSSDATEERRALPSIFTKSFMELGWEKIPSDPRGTSRGDDRPWGQTTLTWAAPTCAERGKT